MKPSKVLIGILFLCAIFLSSPVSGQQSVPSPNCCFFIWGAGCNLGWATSLMGYTKSRGRWVPADQSIVDFIVTGADCFRLAHRQCRHPYLEAFGGWEGIRGNLRNVASSLSRYPDSNNRNRLWKYLLETYKLGNSLRVAIADRKIVTDTCEEKYYKMGWLLAFTQQTLKIADESLRAGRSVWVDQVRDAKRYMMITHKVFYSYSNLRPLTGNCLFIADLRARERLLKLKGLRTTPRNLRTMIQTVDWLQRNIQTRIRNDCTGTFQNGARPRAGTSRNVGRPGVGTGSRPQVSQPPRPNAHLSCKNKDNQEGGCCCFRGAHTYRFKSRYVSSILARFDTGKKLNCRSIVKLQINRGKGWETVRRVRAVSSHGQSTYAPIDVNVSVNGIISGFRISDGCACCIDFSEIFLR